MVARARAGGRNGGYCLMGVTFRSQKTMRVPGLVAAPHRCIEHQRTAHLEMIGMVNFTLCEFYHNKKKKTWEKKIKFSFWADVMGPMKSTGTQTSVCLVTLPRMSHNYLKSIKTRRRARQWKSHTGSGQRARRAWNDLLLAGRGWLGLSTLGM